MFLLCIHIGFGMNGSHGNLIEDLQEYRVSWLHLRKVVIAVCFMFNSKNTEPTPMCTPPPNDAGSVVVHRRRSRCSNSGHFSAILHTQHCGSQPWETFFWSKIALFFTYFIPLVMVVTYVCCKYPSLMKPGNEWWVTRNSICPQLLMWFLPFILPTLVKLNKKIFTIMIIKVWKMQYDFRIEKWC